MIYRISMRSKRNGAHVAYVSQKLNGYYASYPQTFLDRAAAETEAERLNGRANRRFNYKVEPDEAVQAA